MLYPLKFKPIFKDKIWGGEKIKTVLGKDFSPLPNCGESWEISGISTDPSEVSNSFLAGNTLAELVEVYMGDLVGEKVYQQYGNDFPLLIKFIDAADDLSVQVHPNDRYAQKKGFPNGKTEMWYVLAADENARINVGFNKNVTQDELREHLEKNTLEEVLNYIPVKTGDAFFIPAGVVHAICKGVLLAEIQQSSDLTYRLYDYNRPDVQGNLRELHVEDALQVINYQDNFNASLRCRQEGGQVANMVSCPYFSANYLHLDAPIERIYADVDSFVIYICTQGEAVLIADEHHIQIYEGECILLPACFEQALLKPASHCEIIETYLP